MNSKNENKITMWMVLRTFLIQNTNTTDGLPGFAALFAILNSSTDEVLAMMDELGITTKGTTAGKQQTKDLLALKIAEMAGMTRAFAVIGGDVNLQKQMQLPKSTLAIASDLKLIGKGKEVLDAIVLLGGKLTGYGITEQHIADLTALIGQYTLTMPQTRSGIDNRKHTNEELLAVIKTGDDAIEKMDALVEIIRYSKELFYTDYYTRRKIIDKGSHTRALQLWVVDDASGLPVVKAKVIVRPKTGTDLQQVVKSTGAKGGLVIATMDAAEYEYDVSYGGYLPETGSFFVNDGVMTEVTVRLKK